MIQKRKKVNCIVYLKLFFDWKECRTEKFIQQKLDYIHWNPCKGNRLVELPEQYAHGSAKFYLAGEQGIYPVTNFMKLRDVDLIKGIVE